ncbi:hypothetical protein VNI00_015725 [Paramarasmius palmivorus]|uniref:Uncharacterized protein n=1 Tax=Paramarasmius palmivorus TaxID=297713 RepID=A0AAW0BI03_9AGAR
MKTTPEFKQGINNFRTQLKLAMRRLAEEVAGPLPARYTDNNGCVMESSVNYGETDFANIGRIYVQCVNPRHTHKYATHNPGYPSPEDRQRFRDLRAVYELSGAQFNSQAGQLATEAEKLNILDMLLIRVLPPPSAPTTSSVATNGYMLSPPPSSPPEMTISSSTALGKRRAVEPLTPSKPSKAAKNPSNTTFIVQRRAPAPFPLPPPTPKASTSTSKSNQNDEEEDSDVEFLGELKATQPRCEVDDDDDEVEIVE